MTCKRCKPPAPSCADFGRVFEVQLRSSYEAEVDPQLTPLITADRAFGLALSAYIVAHRLLRNALRECEADKILTALRVANEAHTAMQNAHRLLMVAQPCDGGR